MKKLLIIFILMLTIGCYKNTNIQDNYKNIKEVDLSYNNLILIDKNNYLKKDYVPNDLEEISTKYNVGNNNKLRKEVKNKFEEMAYNASLENIKLYNVSAYRSYNYQELLYHYYILHFGFDITEKKSAKAGFSEHQSGLSLDINSANISFEKTIEFKWLINNSYKYGFILRYPKKKEKITGYQYEPWHYRYVGVEIAKKIYEDNITFDEYYKKYINI